jgi:hypothetical protein
LSRVFSNPLPAWWCIPSISGLFLPFHWHQIFPGFIVVQLLCDYCYFSVSDLKGTHIHRPSVYCGITSGLNRPTPTTGGYLNCKVQSELHPLVVFPDTPLYACAWLAQSPQGQITNPPCSCRTNHTQPRRQCICIQLLNQGSCNSSISTHTHTHTHRAVTLCMPMHMSSIDTSNCYDPFFS